MKTLAFLQNQWVRDPDKVRRMLAAASDPLKLRRRFQAYALFAGCKTGRNLRKAFGDLCDEIVWEEASLEIGGFSASAFPADLEHMRAMIRLEQPRLVLGFGKIASDALELIGPTPDIHFVYAPHPAARHPDVMDQLSSAAGRVKAILA